VASVKPVGCPQTADCLGDLQPDSGALVNIIREQDPGTLGRTAFGGFPMEFDHGSGNPQRIGSFEHRSFSIARYTTQRLTAAVENRSTRQ
jgi:hypothetical protein